MEPLISIIIPTFNRSQFLGATLDSVIDQAYSSWECLVIDDGSTDYTEELMDIYCRKDQRISYYKRPEKNKRGASACRNYGFQISNGDYIQFLDSDDLLEKVKIKEQVKAIDGESDVMTGKWGGFNHPSRIYQLFKWRYFSYKNFDQGINLLESFGRHKEYFPPHVYLTPRKIIKRAGPWNEELTNNDDGEFFTRVLLQTSNIIFVPTSKVFYRNTSTHKLSDLNTEEKIRSAVKSWKLVESHIKKVNTNFESDLWENAKTDIFREMKKEFSDLLIMDVDYFREQIKNDRFFTKLFLKLKGNVFSSIIKMKG